MASAFQDNPTPHPKEQPTYVQKKRRCSLLGDGGWSTEVWPSIPRTRLERTLTAPLVPPQHRESDLDLCLPTFPSTVETFTSPDEPSAVLPARPRMGQGSFSASFWVPVPSAWAGRRGQSCWQEGQIRRVSVPVFPFPASCLCPS